MTTEQALEIYRKCGAVLKGHFKLTSGRHADTYMQSAKVFVDTECSEQLCKALVEKLNAAGVEADMVISPAIGGILMGVLRSRAKCASPISSPSARTAR